MELDIKQILQHVINGVNIEILNYKSDYVGIQFAKANGYYYLGSKLHITYEGGSTGKSLVECRLLLRPWSDLTSNIDNDLKNVKYYRLLSDCYSRHDIKSFISNPLLQNYSDIQILLSYNFDIYNQIGKTAIDINTIK